MAPITRFEDIEGWQKSRALCQRFSEIAESAPINDRNLVDQMRRSAGSAMSNIAEGFDAGSNPEFVRFLKMSYRSLTEFQSHLYACKDQRRLSSRDFDMLYEMARAAKSKVGGFIEYLKSHPKPRKKHGARKEPRTPNKPRTQNSEL